MNWTIKAIMARFNGNVLKAHTYCIHISETATNPALRKEYRELAQRIWHDAVRAEGAHA